MKNEDTCIMNGMEWIYINFGYTLNASLLQIHVYWIFIYDHYNDPKFSDIEDSMDPDQTAFRGGS